MSLKQLDFETCSISVLKTLFPKTKLSLHSQLKPQVLKPAYQKIQVTQLQLVPTRVNYTKTH
jgi:hypothetical protein